MEFKKHFKVKKIVDEEIDVGGEEELKKQRTVTLEASDEKITLKGLQEHVTGFKTDDYVEVRITNTQTELPKE